MKAAAAALLATVALLAPDAAVAAVAPPGGTPQLPVGGQQTVPKGWQLSARQAIRIADRRPEMRELRRERRVDDVLGYQKGSGLWQVSYFAKGHDEIGQVLLVDDGGRVLEAWTGRRCAGRWRAATTGRSGAASTHRGSGSRFASSSCCPSSTRGGCGAGCISICSRSCRSPPRCTSSTAATSASRHRSPTRRCSTCWRACSGSGAGAARAAGASPCRSSCRPNGWAWPRSSCSASGSGSTSSTPT